MKKNELCEKRVLGAMMTSRACLQDGLSLSAECFSSPHRQIVFQVASSLANEGKEVDIVSVNTYINTHDLTCVPTIDFLLDLTESYSGGMILDDISQLKEIHIQNRIANICLLVGGKSASPVITSAEMIAELQAELDAITATREDRLITIDKSIEKVNKNIEINRTSTTLKGTRTGFQKIDCNGGFHPSDLIIIAGQTSHGKTSFSMSIAMNMVIDNRRIAFYSMEMQHDQLTARLLSMQSGVSSSSIQYSKLDDYDKDKVDWAEDVFRGKYLYYDDKSTISLDEIMASIRQLHMKHDIEGAFIDYLQIVNLSGNSKREQAIADAARKLKNLAKDLGIWIVALSQLSRDKERKGIDRLRDSGQIGEAADTVLIIERPELDNQTTLPYPFSGDSKNKAIIDIAKGRNIGIGKFLCDFDPPRTLFTEVLTPLQEQIKKSQEDDKYGAVDPFEVEPPNIFDI